MEQRYDPTTEVQTSTKPWKQRSIIGLAATTAAAVVIAILYALWPTPTTADAAQSYIDDNREAIAEEITRQFLPDSLPKTPLAAEILESIADPPIPHTCRNAPTGFVQPDLVIVDCTVSAETSEHAPLEIVATITMTVDPDRHSFKSRPEVTSIQIEAHTIRIERLPPLAH